MVGTSCGRGIPLGALAAWAGLAGGDSLHLVCEVIESLTAASSGAPVVVGVDDPHLLDDLSMFVLQQIVQRGVAKVLLTERDDEPIAVGVQELLEARTVRADRPGAVVAGGYDEVADGDVGRIDRAGYGGRPGGI